MIRYMPVRWLCFSVVFVLSFPTVACQKKQAPPAQELAPMDRATPLTPVGTSQTILQKTFALTATKTFPFTIPAHSAAPHLHGIFASFVRNTGGESDDAANVDFLVLTQDQYDDFSHGRQSEALFSVDASHNQAVNVDLPSSLEQGSRYYLIFRSSPGGDPKKVVEANFRVDF